MISVFGLFGELVHAFTWEYCAHGEYVGCIVWLDPLCHDINQSSSKEKLLW